MGKVEKLAKRKRLTAAIRRAEKRLARATSILVLARVDLGKALARKK